VKRIRLFLAAVAVMATMLAAVPGPAMADDFDFDDDFFGNGFFFGDDFFFGDGFSFGGGGIVQSIDQEADSGELSIGFSVS